MTGTLARWRGREDSTGGIAVLLVVASVIAYRFVSKIIDGDIVVEDTFGRLYTRDGGQFGSLISQFLLVLAAGVSLSALTRLRPARVLPGPFSAPLVVLVAWWFACLAIFQRAEPEEILLAGIATVIAAAMVVDPPTGTTLARLNTLRDLYVVASFTFSALNSGFGQKDCRDEKCGIFGGLWSGLTSHENIASAEIALLIPALMVASGRRTIASVAIAAVFVLATGSRTGIAALIIAIGYVLVAKRCAAAPAEKGVPHLVLRAFPLLALLASFVVFQAASGQALTGRGYVFEHVKARMSVEAYLWGAGPEVMKDVLDGWVSGTHGQYPNYLIYTGLLGALLTVAALASLVTIPRGAWSIARIAGLGFVVVPASRFVTEPGWQFALRTIDFATMLIAIGLLSGTASQPRYGSPPGAEPLDRHALPEPEAAVPGAVPTAPTSGGRPT